MDNCSIAINQEILNKTLCTNSLVRIIVAEIYNQVQSKSNNFHYLDDHRKSLRDSVHVELKKTADSIINDRDYFIGVDSILAYSRIINIYDNLQAFINVSELFLDYELDLKIEIDKKPYNELTMKMDYEMKVLCDKIPKIKFTSKKSK